MTLADLNRWRVQGWLRAYPCDTDHEAARGLGVTLADVRRVRQAISPRWTGKARGPDRNPRVGVAQVRLLAALCAGRSFRTGTLAARAGMVHGNAYTALCRLAARGLVRRVDTDGGQRWVRAC